ncbi:hypothetical protein B0H63DRAFT_450595 [Podospora didyma]|uniref:Fungal N-terminal domain-containing protein n=1 Tax=Podospora didyma TaxID=330526 RepID=A0AAE0TVL1_9PEZI|nr:hypothetical protein B0H63DRAFT_450595 [Podospora didyma]
MGHFLVEVLGIAASAISVAAFAGQLAKTLTYLCTLFKDHQNAPKEFERLSTELQLSVILVTIESSFRDSHIDTELEQALKHCDAIVCDLSNIVATFQPCAGSKEEGNPAKTAQSNTKSL